MSHVNYLEIFGFGFGFWCICMKEMGWKCSNQNSPLLDKAMPAVVHQHVLAHHSLCLTHKGPIDWYNEGRFTPQTIPIFRHFIINLFSIQEEWDTFLLKQDAQQKVLHIRSNSDLLKAKQSKDRAKTGRPRRKREESGVFASWSFHQFVNKVHNNNGPLTPTGLN